MKKLILFALLVFLANYIFAQEANFLWAKQMGGTGDDRAVSIFVDAYGNVYSTGTFTGTADFDPGPGTYNLTSSGSGDSYISKLGPTGNFIWAKQIVLSNSSIFLKVDFNGNVYISGSFNSTVDFDPGAGVYNLTSFGSYDIFVTKLNASGNFIWAKQMGGAGSGISGNDIDVDENGNVYTTGYFNGSPDFDPGPGNFNLASFGSSDIFISKLNTAGNFVWAKQLGGTGAHGRGMSIVVNNGYVYTVGWFGGTVDFDPGPGTFYLTGADTYFISKLGASGDFIWAKQLTAVFFPALPFPSVAVDINDNVYTTGGFSGTGDFDPGAGTYNMTSIGNPDIFISKLDVSGNFIWAKQMGGAGSGISGNDIDVDENGNVYTTGYFNGSPDFDPGPGNFNLASFGSSDIFISKLNTAGNFVWAKQMGGAASDIATSIAVDAVGNVYTTGYFNGMGDFDPGTGTYNLTSAGSSDAFVVKLVAQALPVLPDPTFLWAKLLGGIRGCCPPWETRITSTVDANVNVYTIGIFLQTTDFDTGPGTYNITPFGASDIFISKLDASGNFQWAKQIGGTDVDVCGSIAIDPLGNIYLTGWFSGTADFDPGSGIYNMTATFGSFFIVKLDTSGNLVWAKQFGSSSGGLSGDVYPITFDPSGNVYITGCFYGTGDFDPGSGIYNMTSLGSSDIFVSKLDVSGNFIWAKQMGGANGGVFCKSIAVDISGNVYTTGRFTGTADFDPEPGIYNLTSFGYTDIFISKLNTSGNFLWAKQLGGTVNDDGKSIVVDANGNVYTTGYFYGTGDFDPGSGIYIMTPAGSGDIFISKLDASGSFIWAKQMGGSSAYCTGESIKADAIGNIYITGSFTGGSADFDPGTGIYNLTPAGNQDAFITKLDILGNFLWAKQIGGVNSSVVSQSMNFNTTGNIFISGYFSGTSDFDPGTSTYNLTSTITTNIFVVKLKSFQTPFQLPYSSPQNAINNNGNQITIADPIQLGTGTYSYTHNDIKIPALNGALNFTRFYNSLNSNVPGPLGYGWSHTYNYSLVNKQDTAWDIHYPDGHVSTFIPMNVFGQSFPVYSGTFDSLQKNYNNSYSLFTKDKKQYHFDSAGKLDRIIDLNSNITTLNYTGSSLTSIVAPGGRSLILTYSGSKISTVKDPLNRICIYSYDANDNLITVKDPNNGTATFTYDTAQRMLLARNPLSNVIVDNTYDSSGKVISQKDAYNLVTSIVYNSPTPGDATVTNPDNSQIVAHHDAFIRKTSEKDELNFIKSYTYDANSNENGFTNENNQSERRFFDNRGNLLLDTLPGGKITNITYNNFNSPVQVTDAKGFIKTFYYNSVNNNLDSIRYPDNSLQVYYYNGLGQVIQSVDGNGHTTTYTYSPAGDLLSTQTAAGIKQFAYDAAGRKVSSTDENGHTTNYVYDNNDNIITITDALGHTTENTYDANNQLLTVKDKKGFVTTYTYDNKGRKISSTNPKGGVTAYTYDLRDNLISVTDPNSNTVTYTYDAKGRKTSSTNALGTTQYQYDGVGNLLKVIDPTNKTTEYSYTATNKKQSYKDGLGNTTIYAYDLNDNLTSVSDPLNRITLNGYDVVNRLVSVTDAANKTTAVTYDNNGNKKTVVDPNGHTQTYNYDAVNRLINYQDAAGNNYAYSYDSAGNNITLTKPTGTIGKVFDAANRVLTVNNSTGNNYNFTYDNNDNIITMGNNVGTTTMVYDSLNQLKQYQDPYNKTVSFTYDAAGNRTSIIYPGNKTVSYTFDNANNLKTVSDWLSHTFTYTYDSAGRTKQLLYPNGAKCHYGFDNAGRLTSKISRSGTNTIISGSTFTLDAVGNRIAEQRLAQAPAALPSLSRAYSYANDDRMLSDSVWNYTNDSSGNRTAETNGTDTASYTFSVDNLLNNLTDTAGINSTYSYDVAGHRIAKITGSNSNKYVLDISGSLSQVLQITDAGGVVKSNYVYGLGLLERIDAADSVLYYHFDAQHNTTLLTGPDSAIKDGYTYDPFGTMLSHTGNTNQPFTFLGEYGVEQESPGLYYARARYYDAGNGRFLSKDAYPYELNNPQTLNRYVYSTNNPISLFDYTGLYGEQDNIIVKGVSYYADQLSMLTGNFGYYSLKASSQGAGILGNSFLGGIGKGMKVVSYISTATKIGNTLYKESTGQITGTEASLTIFVAGFPYLTTAIGTSLGGPAGGVVGGFIGNTINTLGKEIGESITNTRWGLKASNWLLGKLQ